MYNNSPSMRERQDGRLPIALHAGQKRVHIASYNFLETMRLHCLYTAPCNGASPAMELLLLSDGIRVVDDSMRARLVLFSLQFEITDCA